MKVGIIYYSRSGNTKKAAKILEEKIKKIKVEVDLIEILHEKKPGFLKAGKAALSQKELPILNTEFDLEKYDTIFVGSPTWGSRPSPHIKSFLKRAENVQNKKAVVFITSGGEPEKADTAKFIKEYLEVKGMKTFEEILGFQMKKEEMISVTENIDNFLKKIIKYEGLH